MDVPEGHLSPTTFRSPRGGIRKKHGGHTYVLDMRGRNGERYFRCLNYSEGCKGRLKCNDQGTSITRPHAHTCRPSARPAVSRPADPPRDMFTPTTFRIPTGGIRKRHKGYLYKLQNQRPNGNRYFCCANYGQGCPGRLKCTAAGTIVTQSHMATCRPAAAVPRRESSNSRTDPGHVDQRRMTLCVTPFQPISAFQAVQRTSPTAGPSHQNDDSDLDDEADVTSDPFIQLQTEYLRQKMEIGELIKQKLQLEIQLLRRRTVGDRAAGGAVAPPNGASSYQHHVSVATSPTPATIAPPTGFQQRTNAATTTTPTPTLTAAVGPAHFL